MQCEYVILLKLQFYKYIKDYHIFLEFLKFSKGKDITDDSTLAEQPKILFTLYVLIIILVE